MKYMNFGRRTMLAAYLVGPALVQAQDVPVVNASDSEKQIRPVEEVVVTAQKRAERLQDVPISIAVVGGADLDQSTVQGISEALNRVPGVATSITALGAPQVIVRGVTSSGQLLEGSSTVGYYIDSVPYGFVRSAIVPDSSTYDLQRVEVLRGPQGTLFGVNAQSGAVRILTQEANLEKFELKARTSASSTEDGGENYRGDVAVNVPLVEDRFAVRAVGGYQDLSGWIDKPNDKDANDAQIKNLRLKVRGQATEKLTVDVSSWFSRSDFGAQSIGDDDRTNGATFAEPVSSDYDVYSLRLGYEFDSFELTSATSYFDYSITSGLDLTPFGLPVVQTATFESEVFAHEINLSSTHEGPWRWTLGAIYRENEDRLIQRYNAPVPPVDFSDDSESWAVFGELTRVLLDGAVEVTAGLRYFEDDVTNRENVSFTGLPNAPLVQSNSKFDAVTPRVVVNWHPSAEWTIYTSYAEGFRSGFTQAPNVAAVAPQFPPLEEDLLHNYELGAKARLWGGRLSLDTAVFYIDWEGVQQALRVLIADGIPGRAYINSESASGAGFEIAVGATPIDDLQLSASFSWNDLAVDSDVISGGAVLFDKGDRLNLSPEYTAGLSASYVMRLNNANELELSASGSYISEQDSRTLSGSTRVIGRGDPMLIATTSVSLHMPEHWTATLFIDNLTNENGASVMPAFGVADWAARTRPRTIGAQLEYQF